MQSKNLITLAALAGASLAEEFPASNCEALVSSLVAAAPTVPPAITPFFAGDVPNAPPPDGLLVHPDLYVAGLCSLAGSLTGSDLAEFQSWGPSLLHYASVSVASYDEVVTKCITTGTAAASITSYIHSIASNPGKLCQPTATPSASGNGTAPYPTSAPSYPTATGGGNSTVPTGTPSPTTIIPTAAAARPTNLIAGAVAMGGILGAVALL